MQELASVPATTDCLEVLLSVLKLCPLEFMWIVMHSSSTVDTALLVGLPEQMGLSFYALNALPGSRM